VAERPVRLVRWGEVTAAIEPADREHVAVVGGGGKTTAVFHLARGLAGRTIATTTTRMGHGQDGGLRSLIAPDRSQIDEALSTGPILVWGRRGAHKAIGVPPDVCDGWFGDSALCDNVVVEADGARHRPFKAPGPLEPVIPPTVTTVVSVIGADALGRVIADQCHRPLRVAAVAGCSPYERLTPERAARVLLSAAGSGRNVPSGVRRIVLVTKVPDRGRDALTHELSAELIDRLGGTGECADRPLRALGVAFDGVDYRSGPWPSSD
jgi:probable selenium-dependent hydroxylase accessory protein YqeC